MNTHEFDDIIKQKAQQREADVTPDIWEGINQKKKKRMIPFFWLMTVMFVLGTSAIVWNMNNKSKRVDTASIEKNNIRDNDVRETAGKDKAISSYLIKSTENPAYSKNSETKDKEQSITIAGQISPVISNSNPVLNTESNAGKNKFVPATNKKQSFFITNKTTDTNTGKIFSSTYNKMKTKANARVNMIAGETGDVEDGIENKEKRFLQTSNTLTNNAVAKSNTISGESDRFLNTSVATSIDDEILIKSTASLKTNTADLLLTKKTLSIVPDNDANKKPIAITAVNTKIKNKGKSNNLKIEAGITVVFPLQQYKQPLYVKRVLDKTNIHSEFISDNIKTTIEAGSAFSVSLIKHINKKWSAGAGIQNLRITESLQFTGVETNDNYTYVQRLVNDPAGNFLKTDTVSTLSKDYTTLSGRNIYNNISIPLFIRYQLISRKKWAASLTAGVYIDLLRKYHNSIPGKFEAVYTYGSESASSKNTIGFDVFAGLHVERKLSKKYEWFAEPSFRYNLIGYKTNNLSFSKKIHKPGISVGIARNF